MKLWASYECDASQPLSQLRANEPLVRIFEGVARAEVSPRLLIARERISACQKGAHRWWRWLGCFNCNMHGSRCSAPSGTKLRRAEFVRKLRVQVACVRTCSRSRRLRSPLSPLLSIKYALMPIDRGTR